MDESSQDEKWMRRALALAEGAVGLASPNPTVGCVLVRDDTVVGEGAHRYEARDHAEIAALKQAGAAARGATAYVTLEPCSHHGRTGPCANALIAAGVGRVVAATVDANPVVRGQGVERLREAGIVVEVGLLQAEARALNDGFARYITTRRPLVTLKAAVSRDGKIAPGSQERGRPHWITGEAARAEVQRMRHGSDAILTGIGTVLADDPALTDRTGLPRRRKLLRVVLDASLRLPMDSQLVRTAEGDLLVICAEHVEDERARGFAADGIAVVKVKATAGRLDLNAVLDELGGREMLSVMVEAGSRVNGAFLRAGVVDKVVVFRSGMELGTEALPFAEGVMLEDLEKRLLRVERANFGEDACVSGYLQDAWAALG